MVPKEGKTHLYDWLSGMFPPAPRPPEAPRGFLVLIRRCLLSLVEV